MAAPLAPGTLRTDMSDLAFNLNNTNAEAWKWFTQGIRYQARPSFGLVFVVGVVVFGMLAVVLVVPPRSSCGQAGLVGENFRETRHLIS